MVEYASRLCWALVGLLSWWKYVCSLMAVKITSPQAWHVLYIFVYCISWMLVWIQSSNLSTAASWYQVEICWNGVAWYVCWMFVSLVFLCLFIFHSLYYVTAWTSAPMQHACIIATEAVAWPAWPRVWKQMRITPTSSWKAEVQAPPKSLGTQLVGPLRSYPSSTGESGDVSTCPMVSFVGGMNEA
jgi:hypothetical protein